MSALLRSVSSDEGLIAMLPFDSCRSVRGGVRLKATPASSMVWEQSSRSVQIVFAHKVLVRHS